MVGLISIIIPALDEEALIGRTLDAVRPQEMPFEIIVVDGRSGDRTVEIASHCARVLQSEPGRARQMNAGADAASGDILLFLHADTLLPPGALTSVRRAIIDRCAEAGTFRMQFDRASPLLRFYGACTRIRSPLFAFGDRGQFVRRDVFNAVGGFPEIPIFEDLEMARVLHARGRFAFLPDVVTTSARRFQQTGPLRQQLRNAYLWMGYLAGTNPRRLTNLYPYVRSPQ